MASLESGNCSYKIPAHRHSLTFTECQCHEAGTVSGIGECGQGDGDCSCKARVAGDACDTCEDGYFALEKSNYFGCQGCQCDVGGSLTTMCSGPAGECQCREHVVGRKCQRPENNYYFPDLHHMKHEAEDGAGPNGRDLHFGFDPLVFPEFSWRGYAQMTSAQGAWPCLLCALHYLQTAPGLTQWALVNVYRRRAIQRSGANMPSPEDPSDSGPDAEDPSDSLRGQVQKTPQTQGPGASQSKEMNFPPSKEPTFVTVPGDGSADPFSITPGTWIACIQVEGVLLVELHLRLRVPQIGHYVIMLEYVTEVDQLFVVDVTLKSPGSALAGQVNIYSCQHRTSQRKSDRSITFQSDTAINHVPSLQCGDP
ncbi:hypothetical protein U0070_026460 [Myodes glareolus]|uniref:Laminin EGF-like domain-containing protein n=1 Tax=Myodes glareolus TaxID=447135 RepID=A0AAW0JIW3_MYOGA